MHSRLNETHVNRIVTPESLDAIANLVKAANGEGRAISIAGGRHAMGGQQFGEDTILIDTHKLNRVLSFDSQNGLIEVEAGIRWPELLAYLDREQRNRRPSWGIRQKQTGADRLSIGGALAANVHGRGLGFKPFIDDIESFSLIDAQGRLMTCSRHENAELFKLAIGGYGLFGVIGSVRLRLVPRRKVRRTVQIVEIEHLIDLIEERIANGFLYGDFQFSIASESDDFLRRGVCSCYGPVDDGVKIPAHQKELGARDWKHLFFLAHVNKQRAFEEYSKYYLTTDGQLYWSDHHQLSEYVDDYHRDLDRRLWPSQQGTEMITEIFVPREALASFMADVRGDFRATRVNLIYGTVRFVEKDEESFLPWAKQRFACIIFNLHTEHTHYALEKTAGDFRRLIDRALTYGGSYYLTYHRWATRFQVEACYPQFGEFLGLKKKYDPEERFQSEWYRHYKKMFSANPRP
jgi:FAD/FMN-containing dehydrogenase